MTEGFTELKCLFAPITQNVRFTIVNPETNEESIVKIRDIQPLDLWNVRICIDLTNEQKLIENPVFRCHRVVCEITKPVINNVRIPVEHVRPPKPTKKWSRRYH